MNPLRSKLQSAGYSFHTWPNISANDLKSIDVSFEELNRETVPIQRKPNRQLYFGFTITNWDPRSGQTMLNVRFK